MQTPIDPSGSDRRALHGRVVTMDGSFNVLDRGTVYVEGGIIIAVKRDGEPPPPGFETVKGITTRGTIYPGLIELHNHLSYNVLPLWQVPKRYDNRDQWSGTPTYQKLISGPMKVLGMTPGYIEAVVRYVECKCLLGGVTTSQGIALFSNQGIMRYYRGIVRNVEQTEEADLPEATAKIGDVEAADASKFLARLQRSSCMLLHLSEGVDRKSREHFNALNLPSGEWAVTSALSGIHCVALQPQDFGILADKRASMVWSPLSNILLYGKTADVKAANNEGVRIGLGSDWSSTGSKNLFGELKVARLVNLEDGAVFSDRDLMAMATRNAAEILKWDKVIGSIEAGKRADLLVVSGANGDPYGKFLEAPETSIHLVMINGVPRFGTKTLMSKLGSGTESWRVDSTDRMLNLKQPTADPVVGALKLGDAKVKLADGLRRLPELASQLERPQGDSRGTDFFSGPPQWFLMLDHEDPPGIAQRLYLGADLGGARAVRGVDTSSVQLSQLLEPLSLDPLTVADDPTYLDRLSQQPNLSDFVRENLRGMY